MALIDDVLLWAALGSDSEAITGEISRVLDGVIEYASEHYDLPPEFPPALVQAVCMQVKRIYSRKQSPTSTTGFDGMGKTVFVSRFDPDIDKMFDLYRKAPRFG